MPLTDYECPECGKTLHTDDQIEGICLGDEYGAGGCGEPLPAEMCW